MLVQKARDIYFGALYKLFGLNHPKKSATSVGFDYYITPLSASRARLDPNYSYLLFHASFGDKWCILSFVPELLKLQPTVRLLASRSDEELIRIFLGSEKTSERVVFINNNRLAEIFNYISDMSVYSNPILADNNFLDQTDSVILHGFPTNRIRHSHIVKYPYFSDLHIIHGVPYCTLVKMLMYLPSSSKSVSPKFYTDEDRSKVSELIDKALDKKSSLRVLFNIVNFSNASLSNNQIRIIIDELSQYNASVLLNITQHKKEKEIRDAFSNCPNVGFVEIPGHLLALFSDQMSGIIGVIGGAMNVAAQFSSSHCLSLYSAPVGSNQNLSVTYGGLYGDNIWKMYDIGWNCFSPGRYLDNIDIGDPANLTEADLRLKISNFCKAITKE